jgi:hypothetical protein
MARKLLFTLLVLLVVLILAGTVVAAANKYGIADRREIALDQPAWVGNVLLPAGNYEVRHVMEGETHILVFRQMNVKRPLEARVKCTLTSVAKPIEQTQMGFKLNATNERVLNWLAFKGDRAEHSF